jgi:hypothetical protein
MKWISTQLPVGQRMLQRKQRQLDTCPCCQYQQETVGHLLLCPSDNAITSYFQALENFDTWLGKTHTDPVIATHLIAVMQSLRTTGRVTPNLFPNILMKPHHYNAFKSQHEIGWAQFHEGLISSKWAELQENFYKLKGDRRRGKTWATELITQIWNINFKVWSHRNNTLHHSKEISDTLHGKEILLEAVTYEFNRGKDELHNNFSPFFSSSFFSPHTITQTNTETLRQWFCLIRSAREYSQTDRKDDFSTTGPLRRWIGLPPLP